jgi:hypothetical protein
METYWGLEVYPLCLISAIDGGKWPASSSHRFIPGERAYWVCWIWGWVGLRVDLDTVEKGKTLAPVSNFNSDHSAIKPVVLSYTDWANQQNM